MSQSRLSVFAALLTLLVFTLPATAQVVDFGTNELGEIGTSCLGLCFGTNCDGAGTVDSITINPPFYVRGIRRGDFANDLCNNPSATSAATLPATLQPGQTLIFDLDFVATDLGPAMQDLFVNGGPQLPAIANVVPAPACPPSATDLLCLNNDRFTVRGTWRTQFGTRGVAPRVLGVPNDDSGLLYFFNPDNWEILIKVLDGCPVNNHFWVFYAATTNVEFTLTVTDTQAQEVKVYGNPLGMTAEPIQDTQAFATCP
jgi:hypothetical protein